MSDLSASRQPTPETAPAAESGARSLWPIARKSFSRLQDWFVIQSSIAKVTVAALCLLIPASAFYSVALMQQQAVVAEELKSMTAADPAGQAAAPLNTKLPVLFGTGSVLGFLEHNPAERITVIYKPLMWNVSERIVVIESQGKQYAWYPNDMETKIFAEDRKSVV